MRRSLPIYLCAVLAVVVLLISACVAPAATTGGAAAPSAATSGEKVKLRFANWADANEVETLKPIIAEFQKQNPNIEVSMESVAGSGAALYPDTIKTAMASGDPPDVFWMWMGQIQAPFIKAQQVLDPAPYYEKYGWEKILSGAAMNAVKNDGKLWGIPRLVHGMGFYYRKDIFDKLGIKVPTTFAEQEQACATLKENNIYCVSIGGKYFWHTMRVLDYFLETRCGPEIHDALNRREQSWDQQCVVDAYQTMRDWLDKGWIVPDFLTVAPDDARWPVIKGDAAMVLEGGWFEGILENDGQDMANWGFYIPPTDHTPVRFSSFAEQAMIAAGAKHPDEAAAFINFMTLPETQKQYPDFFKNSATIGINPDCTKFPINCNLRELLATGDTYPPTDTVFPKELIEGWFEVQDGVVAGKYTAADAAKTFQQRVDEWSKANPSN